MKKILLSLFFISLFASAFAQSFSLQDTNGVAITAGSKVYIIGDPASVVMTAKIWVKNNAGEAKEVKVKKFHVDVLANTMNYFCWGVCYGPDTYESPFGRTIEGGAVSHEFYGDYNPQAVIGKSTIMYTFFDAAKPNDSVAVYVEFNGSPASAGQEMAGSVSFSEAYPNPAVSKVNVDYSLPVYVKEATIQITNMLGAKVREIKLEELSGTARIEVSELQNGIYFYSLVADNKLVLTRKFVVKH
jgi:hypothetical protein